MSYARGMLRGILTAPSCICFRNSLVYLFFFQVKSAKVRRQDRYVSYKVEVQKGKDLDFRR